MTTFVYDGDCAFCSTCARFIERRIRPDAAVVAWQHIDHASLGLAQADCEESVWWVAPDRRAGGPDAIAELLVDAGRLWALPGRVLRLRAVSRLAWPVYRLIARNRHRLPGGTATCSLPQAERDRLAAEAAGLRPRS